MKILKFTFALLSCATLFTACSSDDDTTATTEEDLAGQTGDLVLKFDNGVGDQDFIFGTEYSKSNNETYKLETVKYIISNVRFTDEDGNVFEYPTDDNIFIVNEEDGNNAGEIFITLDDVDAADYVSVTYGIGVDQERYQLGAEGQGEFLEEASEEGMMWNWSTGYRFVRLDGTYTDATVTDEALNIHMGSVGTSLDNYRETTLLLPNSARVREDSTPEVHIKADLAKIFDGVTSVNFADGYAQVHTSTETTPVIADNMQAMFSVDHVHND
ncbi:hypothetical protein SCB49_04950 [unidentified eubacterium SCB49]|nr:hypothetical protein SCB49_04950 [unidentified eubacterium SCB49]